jgi:hypothetical protein
VWVERLIIVDRRSKLQTKALLGLKKKGKLGTKRRWWKGYLGGRGVEEGRVMVEIWDGLTDTGYFLHRERFSME